jgi:predicted MPP superfamily phosphohydrolase
MNPGPVPTGRSSGVRFGLIVAGAVTAYAVLVYAALRPLHEHGFLQPVFGFLQGLDYVLQAPGLMLAQRLGLRAGHHTTAVAWAFSLAVNAAVYFVLAVYVRRLFRRRPSAEASPPSAGLPTPVPSRRRFLAYGVRTVAAGAGAALGYALLVEPRRFVVSRREIPIRGLPRELDGLRLVQLTDIHHGPWLSLGYVRAVVDAANELRPDLVCLTGDYVHHSAAYIEPVVAELARLRPRVATVAVLGNHDWWEDAERMRRAFARTEVVLLDNDHRVLTPGRRLETRAERGLAVCGVGDLWEDIPDYVAALGGLPEAMPRLLLSHNPDVAEEPGLVRGGQRVDLMLSGHTHGGQIRLPGLGTPITSSRYGQKYARGLVEGPSCPVFVCPGVGVSGLPLRFGVPPEVAVLVLRAAPLEAG